MTVLDVGLEGLYNAGRHEVQLDRKLTDTEWQWYLNGFIPASVKRDGEIDND